MRTIIAGKRLAAQSGAVLFLYVLLYGASLASDEEYGAARFACCFRVVGVAAHDTLNVRANPADLETLVTRLSPYATGIRVAGCIRAGSANHVWCEIWTGQHFGWVAGRYLARQN